MENISKWYFMVFPSKPHICLIVCFSCGAVFLRSIRLIQRIRGEICEKSRGHTIPSIWIKRVVVLDIPFKQFYELWLAYLVDHSHGWHGSDQRQSKIFFFVKPIRNYYLYFCRERFTFICEIFREFDLLLNYLFVKTLISRNLRKKMTTNDSNALVE